MACLFGHKWNGCTCARCGKKRDEGHDFQPVPGKCIEKCSRCGKERAKAHQWDGERCVVCGAPNPDSFYLEVCNKYSAFGGLYAEGKMKYGQLRVGDRVYVYDGKGRLKFDGAKVVAMNDERGIRAEVVKAGEATYAAIRLDQVQNIGDIENKDIITKQRLSLEAPPEEEPAEKKELPPAKTYSDPDRRKHVTMATSDIASMCASGSLAANRAWIRDVGQDLYDAHGFEAMQEVFINVKTRYPGAQSQLSSIWDGVGGWAD